MPRKVQVTKGDVYNHLIIQEEIEGKKRKSGHVVRRVRCKCKCGSLHDVCLSHLRNGGIKSCGCIRGGKILHGHSIRGKTTKEYKTYMGMSRRCYNPNDKRYSDYGGRGIIIERDSFEDFYRDMGDAPSNEYSIDRIDGDGNYCKENCRWATKVEQARNKRTNRVFCYMDVIGTTGYICDVLGIETNPKTIYQRIVKYGRDIDRAFET